MLIMFSQLRKRGSRGVSGVRHRFNGTDKVRSFPGWRVGNQPAPSIPTTLQRRIISSGSLWSTKNTDPTYGRHGLSRKCVAPVVTVQFTFKRSNLGGREHIRYMGNRGGWLSKDRRIQIHPNCLARRGDSGCGYFLDNMSYLT
jgi:hypothetical protein